MLHLQATKKLLSSSRLAGELFITKEDKQQYLQNWYVTLTGSGFPGKFIVMYVHQPSLLTIFVKGKTIKNTFPEFIQRLRSLLERFAFPAEFIETELSKTSVYAAGKTSNRSMLSHINQMLLNVDWWVRRYSSYEAIDLVWMENQLMDYLFKSKGQKDYSFPLKYWEEKLDCKLMRLDEMK